MSQLIHLPNSRALREQAAAWIVALEEGLSAEQMIELKAWLAADPAHRAAFLRMAEQWDDFDALAELSEILPLRAEPARVSRFTLAGAALATIAVCAIGAGFYFAAHPRPLETQVALASTIGPVEKASPVTHSLSTAVGEHLTSKMPDGSTISLNTNTTLTVEFSHDERLVVLEKGEASFSVEHDATRPFLVRAGERTVQAVGTAFNVRRDAGRDVRVTVTEGVVKIVNRRGASDGDVLVRAGQLVDIGEVATRIQRVEPSRLDAAQAWQRGVLIYQGETLEDVIADVSRYTPVHFRIEDDSIRQRRVGGVFRAGDVDGLLLALRETFGIEPTRQKDGRPDDQGDTIVLSAKE